MASAILFEVSGGCIHMQAIVHSQACDETGAGSLLMIGILRVTATYCSPTRIVSTIGGPGINADNIWVYIYQVGRRRSDPPEVTLWDKPNHYY